MCPTILYHWIIISISIQIFQYVFVFLGPFSWRVFAHPAPQPDDYKGLLVDLSANENFRDEISKVRVKTENFQVLINEFRKSI
jgi:hypothetical protein